MRKALTYPSHTELSSMSMRKKKHVWTALFLILLFAWSLWQTESSLLDFIHGFSNMFDLLIQMVPPNWAYFDNVVPPMLDTIRMALLGTTIGAILAIPFALLSASNVFKNKALYYPIRFILNLIRTIPELLLAAIFVAILGLGPLPGIFALGIFSMGIIAKLTYEATEGIDPGPLEAMTAVGANKIQWIVYSVVPQVTPYYVSFVLYALEINVRAAAILGLVGAGGIGEYYDKTLGFLEYDKVSTIIICTLLVVLAIDYVSMKLREKLL